MTPTDEPEVSRADLIKKYRNEIDDYQATVDAVVALAHELRFDPREKKLREGTVFGLGYPLRTSADNAVSKNTVVTPDLIVVLEPRYGVLAEAKASFPSNRKLWISTSDQIKKYDDRLAGWPSPADPQIVHDVILLLHNSRKVAVADHFDERQEAGELEFERNFAIVAFSRVIQGNQYISLERSHGKLSRKSVDQKLRNVVQIPTQHLVENYTIKFYDSEPPLPYLMTILWQDVFPALEPIEGFRSSRLKQSVPRIRITAEDAAKMLQAAQLSRAHGFAAEHRRIPKRDWVLNALEALRRYGFATRPSLSTSEYEIQYKKIRDPLFTFIRKVVDEELKSSQSQRRHKKAGQMEIEIPDFFA